MTVQFTLLISRQGKVRLAKWYSTMTLQERNRAIKEITHLVVGRSSKLCSFLDWQNYRIIFKRYASLYFIMCVEKADNELLVMETIHHFVEVLDRYFGNVCELDLIFHFHKAYFILDEVLLNGQLQESSKKAVIRVIQAQDALMDSGEEISAKAI